MIREINSLEISSVTGQMSVKSILSSLAAVFTGSGTLLQAWGQSIHVSAPNISDATQTSAQRKYGIIISLTGLALNIASLGLSTFAASVD